ncbi:MAG: prepilin-type N-terminal cleavage/methylation domain-containing protein [Planctomycetota bacterium]
MLGRRGLTLIEVLASLALLSVLAAAVVPLYRIDRVTASPSISVARLGILADQMLDELDQLEIGEQDLSTPGYRWAGLVPDRLATGDEASDLEIRLLVLRPDTDEARGTWVRFESGGQSVIRWIRKPDEADEPEAAG